MHCENICSIDKEIAISIVYVLCVICIVLDSKFVVSV